MSETPGIQQMTDVGVLEHLQQLNRQRSTLDAQIVRAMAHFNQLRQGTRHADGKYVADEVAAALDWAPRTASSVVHTAVQLATRLSDTVDALEHGQLDLTKARAILEWTEPR